MKGVTHGTLALWGSILAARGLDAVFLIVLARTLGAAEFGRFSYASSFVLLFSTVTDLGLTTVFTREVSSSPHLAGALARRILALKAGLGGLAIAISLTISVATGGPPELHGLVAVLGVALAINSIAALHEGLLKAAGRAGAAGVSIVAQSACGSATGLAVLALGGGVWAGAWSALLGSGAHLAFAALAARREHRRAGATPEDAAPLPPFARSTGRLLREAMPLAFSGAFIALYFRIDTVLLHALRDERAVGLYAGVYRGFALLAVLGAAWRSVLFPVLARAADGPAEALAALCRRAVRVQIVGSVFLATFASIEAGPIVRLALGEGYVDAARAFAVLMWAVPAAFLADLLFHVLVAQRRATAAMRVVGVVAALNVALNLALIPRGSFEGAAVATLVSELACAAGLFVLARRGVQGLGLAGSLARPLAAALPVGAALMLAHSAGYSGPVALIAAAVFALPLYAATALAWGAVVPDDFRAAFGSRRAS